MNDPKPFIWAQNPIEKQKPNRKIKTMKTIAQSYSPRDLENDSLYYPTGFLAETLKRSDAINRKYGRWQGIILCTFVLSYILWGFSIPLFVPEGFTSAMNELIYMAVVVYILPMVLIIAGLEINSSLLLGQIPRIKYIEIAKKDLSRFCEIVDEVSERNQFGLRAFEWESRCRLDLDSDLETLERHFHKTMRRLFVWEFLYIAESYFDQRVQDMVPSFFRNKRGELEKIARDFFKTPTWDIHTIRAFAILDKAAERSKFG